jgi:hypothetical protein
MTTSIAAPMVQEAFQRAFDNFNSSMKPKDRSYLANVTTEADLRVEILKLEKQQASRQAAHNIRQIQPFLDFLRQYHRVIEVFVGVISH